MSEPPLLKETSTAPLRMYSKVQDAIVKSETSGCDPSFAWANVTIIPLVTRIHRILMLGRGYFFVLGGKFPLVPKANWRLCGHVPYLFTLIWYNVPRKTPPTNILPNIPPKWHDQPIKPLKNPPQSHMSHVWASPTACGLSSKGQMSHPMGQRNHGNPLGNPGD